MIKRKGNIYVGTSGWHYKHWVGTFYPAGTKDSEQLSYYIKIFKTVELNNSFYHLPPPQTFKNWRKAVPGDFIFVVKGSRYISHLKKLNVEKESINFFFNSVNKLKEKLGPILFQQPPKWKCNPERLEDFSKNFLKNIVMLLSLGIKHGIMMKSMNSFANTIAPFAFMN